MTRVDLARGLQILPGLEHARLRSIVEGWRDDALFFDQPPIKSVLRYSF